MVEILYNYLGNPVPQFEEEFVKTDDHQHIYLQTKKTENPKAILVLFLGLGGDATACYIRPWYEVEGYELVIVNRRGTHPKNKLQNPKRYPTHADVKDVQETLRYLRKKYRNNRIVGIGYSAGAVHMMNALLRTSENLVDSCVCVSSNFNIIKTYDFLMRSPFYNHMIADGIKNTFLNNPHIFKPGAWLRTLTSIDGMVSKLEGFESQEEYYNHCSCAHLLKNNKYRTLYIMSRDDPLLDGMEECLNEVCSQNPLSTAIITDNGGHVAWITNDCKTWIIEEILSFISFF
jgi:predicted alpha/beta-fold hydrolase